MQKIQLPNGVFEFDPNRPLGKPGGFGQVFCGLSPTNSNLAIKKLHVSAADAAHRELKIAEQFSGRPFQNVIPFIDAGEDPDSGSYFIVMPRAEKSLQELIDSESPCSPAEAAAIMLQILSGLLEVPELVHRDLKPANVLFHENRWKVADFGIARFVEQSTSSNTLRDCLTPEYAAPEQCRRETATPATDVYALGCIGYCLLSGSPPFTENPEVQHQNAPIPPFNCTDSRLRSFINMMLRKNPQARPTHARLKEALKDITNLPFPGEQDTFSHLADAGARVAEVAHRADAERVAILARRKARGELAVQGSYILRDNTEELWNKISNHAPVAHRASAPGSYIFHCSLGDGQLYVQLPENLAGIPEDGFPRSGWDVLAEAKISVFQPLPPHQWTASLWYAKIDEPQGYRWYEVSYWTPLAHITQQPFAAPDSHIADLAATRASDDKEVFVAYGPVPIDDESQDDFHHRWTLLLAKASTGNLRCPTTFPIQIWPGF